MKKMVYLAIIGGLLMQPAMADDVFLKPLARSAQRQQYMLMKASLLIKIIALIFP